MERPGQLLHQKIMTIMNIKHYLVFLNEVTVISEHHILMQRTEF